MGAATPRLFALIIIAFCTTGLLSIVRSASAAECGFSYFDENGPLAEATISFPVEGGSRTLTVLTQPGCAWSARKSAGAPWLTIDGSLDVQQYIGTASVVVTAVPNPDASLTRRFTTIMLADLTFRVLQAAPPLPPPPCTFSLSPTFAQIADVVSLTSIFGTFEAGCGELSVGSSAPWLRLSINGPGFATANSTRNLHRAPRTATITVARHLTGASQSVTVEQAGAVRHGSLPIDVNGDGFGDALLYNPTTGAATVRTVIDPYFRSGPEPESSFVTVGSAAWSSGWTIRPADFNGDALTDFFFYNPATGAFYKGINIGAAQFSFFGYYWSPGWQPTVVDFNDDGLSDVFVYNSATGRWFTCITVPGQDDFVYVGGVWSPNWQVFPADFDADGRTDLFVYNANAPADDANSGRWYRIMTQPNGSFEYVPGDVRWSPNWQITPTDFNGDGRTDLFVYAPASGVWYTVQFTSSSAIYRTGLWATDWTITPGDFTGDQVTDLFLYNRSSGRWFVAVTLSPGEFAYSTGTWSPGWDVSVTDFNGDRVADLLLYNSANGIWYQATTVAPGEFSFTTGTWPTGAVVVATERRF